MPKITVPIADFEALTGYRGKSQAEILELLKLCKGELDTKHCTDEELRIELQDTNRPDTWCVEGIARLLRSHRDGKGKAYPFFDSEEEPTLFIDAHASVEAVRPYVAGFVAKGYSIDGVGLKAFISAQEVLCRNFGRMRKTVAIGIYDASPLTFPVKYEAIDADDAERAFVPLAPGPVTDDDGEPLSHDGAGNPIPAERWEERWTCAQILADHPTGRQYAEALSVPGKAPLLTDAKGQVLSFPPIINSAALGRVSEGMSELFVEVTGTTLDQVLLATNILAANLFDRGATIQAVVTRYAFDTPRGREVRGPHPLPDRRSVDVPLSEFGRLLGEVPSLEDATARLEAFGLDVSVAGPTSGMVLTVATQPFRCDYLHPVDAIEDYAISRSYESFEPLLPEEFTVGSLAPETVFSDLVRDLAIGCGFDEAIGNLLTAPELLRDRMCVGDSDGDGDGTILHGGALVRIENVMNLNYSVMRDWVLPTLMEVESNSTGAIFPHRVFEVGEVCGWDAEANLRSRTEWRLGALMANHLLGFSDIQATMHEILRTLGFALDLSAKAKELGVPVLDEDALDAMTETGVAGRTFVITGTLPRRSQGECKAAIEAAGGKVTGTLSKQTDYLVCGQQSVGYTLKPGTHPTFIPGRTAWIEVAGECVGVVGEVHPQVLENWKIHAPVGAFELRLEPLRVALS